MCILLLHPEHATTMNTNNETIKLNIEFSGGLELLFGKVKKHNLELPITQSPLRLRHVVLWLRDHLLKERPELFVVDDSVRPGILVLINDVDWELLSGVEYEVQSGDTITFISTLHGG